MPTTIKSNCEKQAENVVSAGNVVDFRAPKTALEYALNLAGRGIHIHPLRPGGKLPAKKGWKALATTDPATIRAWWTENPRYNVGVATGAEFGIMVVDIDVSDGKPGDASLQLLELVGDVPPTLTWKTATGGRHLIYKTDFEFQTRANANEDFPAIDIRGWYGNIAGPGSVRKGKRYEIVNDAPIAEAPTFFRTVFPPKTGEKPDLTAPKNPLCDEDLPENEAEFIAYLVTPGRAPETLGDGGSHDRMVAIGYKGHDFGISQLRRVQLILEHYNPAKTGDYFWEQDELEDLIFSLNNPQNRFGCDAWTVKRSAASNFDDDLSELDLGSPPPPDETAGHFVRIMIDRGMPLDDIDSALRARLADHGFDHEDINAIVGPLMDAARRRADKKAAEASTVANDNADAPMAVAEADPDATPEKPAPATAEAEPEGKPVKKSRFRTVSLAELAMRPPTKWTIGGWIPENSVGIVYGKWGTGKSFVAIDWAMHIACGLPNWHDPLSKLSGKVAKVLYIAREGHQGLGTRAEAFCRAHDIPLHPETFRLMEEPVNLADDGDYREFKTWLRSSGETYALVIVDTVARAMPGKEMGAPENGTLFMERLATIGKEAGCTAVGVHHENKSGGMMGSEFYAANSDFVFRVEKVGTGPLVESTVTCVKMKDSADGWSQTVKFTPEVWGDGEAMRDSLYVSSVEKPDSKKGVVHLTPAATAVLETLEELVETEGVERDGRKAIAIAKWRTAATARVSGDNDAARGKNWRNGRKELRNLARVSECDEFAWVA